MRKQNCSTQTLVLDTEIPRVASSKEWDAGEREASKRTIESMATTERTAKGKITKGNNIVAIARATYEAYVAKNRAVIEKLVNSHQAKPGGFVEDK
jgi:hypothetical protein